MKPQKIMAGDVRPATVPDIEELIGRAEALAPALARRARAAEEAACLPAETIADLREAGLFRLMQPVRYGGHGLDFESLVRVTIALGKGCGSTAWVYSVGAFHSWNIALFSEAAQMDVWGENPDALAASSYVPAGTAQPVDGGVRISGRWPFASGSDHFEWIILGAKDAEAPSGQLGVHLYLIPRTDYAIDRDWDVAGLAATGSNTVVLDDVFVPAHRALSFDDARRGAAPGAELHGGLYRLPFFAVSSYCLVSPALGIAWGALQDYIDDISGREVRSVAGAASNLAGYAAVQMRVAEASGLVDAATELILRDCREMVAMLHAGRPIPDAQRVRNKRDQALAVRLAKQTVQLIMDGSGAKGLNNDRPIQRAWRDLQAASSHITLSWDILMPAYGRMALGLEPGILI